MPDIDLTTPIERRPIPDSDGYFASSDGRIYERDRELVPRRRADGYLVAHVRWTGVIRRSQLVHALVLFAFSGPRPPGMLCRHLDGCKQNNHIGNLRWGTPAENIADKSLHGTQPRGRDLKNARLHEEDIVQMSLLYQQGLTQLEIGQRFGIHQVTVSAILRGKKWPHVVRPLPLKRNRFRITPESLARAYALSDAGHSWPEIADQLGMGRCTMYKVAAMKKTAPAVVAS